jgi:hypothetical protein
LVAPLKFIYSSIQVSGVLTLTVHWKLISFVFQILPLFIPEISASFTSYFVQVTPIYLILNILHETMDYASSVHNKLDPLAEIVIKKKTNSVALSPRANYTD